MQSRVIWPINLKHTRWTISDWILKLLILTKASASKIHRKYIFSVTPYIPLFQYSFFKMNYFSERFFSTPHVGDGV